MQVIRKIRAFASRAESPDLGVNLPPQLLAQMGCKKGDAVTVSTCDVEGGRVGIIIESAIHAEEVIHGA